MKQRFIEVSPCATCALVQSIRGLGDDAPEQQRANLALFQR
jgi:hypothetical protein